MKGGRQKEEEVKREKYDRGERKRVMRGRKRGEECQYMMLMLPL